MAKGTKTLNKGLKVAEAWDGSAAYEHEVFVKVRNSAPTDGDIANGELVFYLDEGVANKLMVRLKYSDGTAKDGELALT